MDFVTKHYEKLILVAVLIGLIGTAVFLAYQFSVAGAATVTGTPGTPSRDGDIQTPDLAPVTAAIDSLKAPALWNAEDRQLLVFGPTRGPATRPEVVAPRPTPTLAETIGPIVYERHDREFFNLLFMSYSYDAASDQARNFQINFRNRDKTFFVPSVSDMVRDRFESTGYKVASFERVITRRFDPRVGAERDVDESKLTIEFPGEDPIILQRDRLAMSREPIATIRCVFRQELTGRGVTPAPPQQELAFGPPQGVRRGQTFTCGQRAYNVVDIKPDKMIIVDAQSPENQIEIPLGRPAAIR
jgi:hypothetical protein